MEQLVYTSLMDCTLCLTIPPNTPFNAETQQAFLQSLEPLKSAMDVGLTVWVLSDGLWPEHWFEEAQVSWFLLPNQLPFEWLRLAILRCQTQSLLSLELGDQLHVKQPGSHLNEVLISQCHALSVDRPVIQLPTRLRLFETLLPPDEQLAPSQALFFHVDSLQSFFEEEPQAKDFETLPKQGSQALYREQPVDALASWTASLLSESEAYGVQQWLKTGRRQSKPQLFALCAAAWAFIRRYCTWSVQPASTRLWWAKIASLHCLHGYADTRG